MSSLAHACCRAANIGQIIFLISVYVLCLYLIVEPEMMVKDVSKKAMKQATVTTDSSLMEKRIQGLMDGGGGGETLTAADEELLAQVQ